MKINESIVVDDKVIDELMAACMHSGIYEVLEYIKQQSMPLEPIVINAYNAGKNGEELELIEKEVDNI